MKLLIAMDGLGETEELRYSRAGSQYSERFGLVRVPYAIASRKEEYAAAKKRRREDEVCVQNLDVALASAAGSVPLDAMCNRQDVAPDGPSQMQDVHSSMSCQPGSAEAYLNGGWMQDLDSALALGKYWEDISIYIYIEYTFTLHAVLLRFQLSRSPRLSTSESSQTSVHRPTLTERDRSHFQSLPPAQRRVRLSPIESIENCIERGDSQPQTSSDARGK